MFLLKRFLTHFVETGKLTVIDAAKKVYHFGTGDGNAPEVAIALKSPGLARKLALRPELYLGEAYMNGELEIVRGTLPDLLDLCGRNLSRHSHAACGALKRATIFLVQRLTQWNSMTRARRSVAHHYDLAHDLYASFLDRDLQYSCAYFREPQIDLDQAQTAKRMHLAAKLLLKRNHRVLDIGCGWGGLAIDLARRAQVRVDGITLSREQLAHAIQRARTAGVAEDVRFFFKDYRSLQGCYDRIVSVGMFEHVGAPYYRVFFRKVHDLLAPDGVAVLHSIGASDGPGVGNPWIRKYIFPGGYVPALSEVLPAVESAGLVVTDVEILRLHYAETLKKWRERFLGNWDTIKYLYDDRFRRMWEFYLASSEMAFRHAGLMVFQMQIARRQEAVPLTRDYLFDYERAAQTRTDTPCDCAA